MTRRRATALSAFSVIAVILTRVKRHYDRVEAALELSEHYRSRRHTHTVVVPVGGVHQGVLAALTYAKSLAPDRLRAVKSR